MKKHLFLLLFLAFAAITGYSQSSIPNGNFETWTTTTLDNPLNYPYTSNINNFYFYNLPENVTKITDSYHNTYALQLTTNASATDTSAAYCLNYNPNNSGSPNTWHGGIPYSQMPAGIRGYYKYNEVTVDSATVIVAFSKAGANIGTYMYTIGGIKSSYTLFQFTFTPALTVTPDSVIFGAVSCKIGSNGPRGIAGEILKIDSVTFTGVSSQPLLMNGDFESWQTQTFNKPTSWNVPNGSYIGVNRTTDAAKGTYAVELTTILGNNNNHAAAQPGWVSTGYFDQNCSGNCEHGGYPFVNQIDTLAFYYKYTPVHPNDSAMINVSFKKTGTFIGGYSVFMTSHSSYQYIEYPFNLGQSPDSVIVDIMSSLWQDSLLSYVGEDLKIDEVHFKSQPLHTNIFTYAIDNSISIFPNPSDGKFRVEDSGFDIQSVEVFNALGDEVYSTNSIQKQSIIDIDLSGLQKGIYYARFFNGKKNITR
ncbi:MAG: T9SS type A sorting domain-containing protein [Bacteroidales bacterium]